MVQALRGAEQMAGGACVHQKMLIGSHSQRAAHDGQAADKLRHGEFELADEDTSRRRNWKADAVRAGGQRQGEVGDQQRLTHLGFAADKQDALRRQQPRLHQTGRRRRGLLLQQLGQRQHRR